MIEVSGKRDKGGSVLCCHFRTQFGPLGESGTLLPCGKTRSRAHTHTHTHTHCSLTDNEADKGLLQLAAEQALVALLVLDVTDGGLGPEDRVAGVRLRKQEQRAFDTREYERDKEAERETSKHTFNSVKTHNPIAAPVVPADDDQALFEDAFACMHLAGWVHLHRLLAALARLQRRARHRLCVQQANKSQFMVDSVSKNLLKKRYHLINNAPNATAKKQSSTHSD
jgi:hypothetical protein